MKKCLVGFLVFLFCSLLFCCKTTNIENNIQPKMSNMQYIIDTIIYKGFIDSVCVADTIPSDHTQWMPLYQKDYETQFDATQWTYMKAYQTTVYTIQYKDNGKYRFTKRIEIVE